MTVITPDKVPKTSVIPTKSRERDAELDPDWCILQNESMSDPSILFLCYPLLMCIESVEPDGRMLIQIGKDELIQCQCPCQLVTLKGLTSG